MKHGLRTLWAMRVALTVGISALMVSLPSATLARFPGGGGGGGGGGGSSPPVLICSNPSSQSVSGHALGGSGVGAWIIDSSYFGAPIAGSSAHTVGPPDYMTRSTGSSSACSQSGDYPGFDWEGPAGTYLNVGFQTEGTPGSCSALGNMCGSGTAWYWQDMNLTSASFSIPTGASGGFIGAVVSYSYSYTGSIKSAGSCILGGVNSLTGESSLDYDIALEDVTTGKVVSTSYLTPIYSTGNQSCTSNSPTISFSEESPANLAQDQNYSYTITGSTGQAYAIVFTLQCQIWMSLSETSSANQYIYDVGECGLLGGGTITIDNFWWEPV
jgi:hypothetical protein